MTKFVIKRVYEPAQKSDGYRVLADRLWPRGISKEKAKLGAWAKELAPSTELRKWFGHVPDRFKEFTKRYKSELRKNPALKSYLSVWKKHAKVTLLYGARDESNNEAVVLKSFIDNK